MAPTTPTTTSHALLALLAVRSWTAYELTQQMRRALRWMWPRSEANLYNEVKRLERLGYATGHPERANGRNRTRYEITNDGRDALAAWLAEPPTSPPTFESEALLRLYFADQGSRDDLLATIARTRADVAQAAAEILPVLQEYARGDGTFPERFHLNAAAAEAIAAFYRAQLDWCRVAARRLEAWDDPQDPAAVPDADDTLADTIAFYRSVLDDHDPQETP